VAERAGSVGDGMGAAEEVEDGHWLGLRGKGTGAPAAARGRSALRLAMWPLRCPLRCPLGICPLGGRVGARVGGARWVRGGGMGGDVGWRGVGWADMEIGEGVRWGAL
jgi:hypothetical protein